jgi:hypothetical protein
LINLIGVLKKPIIKNFSYRMLPSMSDPKVFAVRCKIGMEKETTITIMNKFIHLMGTPKELLIYSASFIEKFPGY